MAPTVPRSSGRRGPSTGRRSPFPSRTRWGAGDAFVAGYLSALLDGEPVERRLERGVALGAFAVASQGDWEGLPVRDELGLLAAAPGSAIR
ncbi:PfkB family carbohydrate kinase [Streptomyces sp. SBC-4]|nr:PfkB family carbohydrate kinase [Streptomyces sp. SBC-4]MDV5143991.1 PfkB family carbohydrate kinase [Streptomyces sp. SBC-4]